MSQKKVSLERNLNLVFSLPDDKYVFIKPMSKEAYKSYYIVLAALYSRIVSQGLFPSAHAISGMMFREICDEHDKDADAFFAEMKRTSEVAAPSKSGWEQVPYAVAVSRGAITEDDYEEVENFLPFYTAVLFIHNKAGMELTLTLLSTAAMAQATSLNFTAFLDSLPTLKTEESSSKKNPT